MEPKCNQKKEKMPLYYTYQQTKTLEMPCYLVSK